MATDTGALREMFAVGLKLDTISFSAGISACERCGQLHRATSLLPVMPAGGAEPAQSAPARPSARASRAGNCSLHWRCCVRWSPPSRSWPTPASSFLGAARPRGVGGRAVAMFGAASGGDARGYRRGGPASASPSLPGCICSGVPSVPHPHGHLHVPAAGQRCAGCNSCGRRQGQ